MSRLAPLLLAAVIAAPTTAAADESGLRLYPIRGLFGPADSACGKSGRTDNLISPALCDKLEPIERRQYWGERFNALIADRFGSDQVTRDLSALPPAGMTRETLISRTLVASLHVSRADLWVVPKASVVETHMPITVTLLMTNVLTGEVMFAHSVSTNVQGLMERAGYQAEAAAQFDRHFDAALVRLVDEARTRFQPNAVTTQVRSRNGDLYVVDAGLQKGLRPGDQIGADARVVFADAHYAVVAPALDALSVGQTLSRYVAQPLDALSRPSVLVVVADTAPDMPRGYAAVIMEEALSAAGGFALVQINPAASAIRAPQLTAAGVESRPPALPDYFLRVTVAPLEPVQAATNVRNVDRRVQDARVFLEVIDHDGRAVFAVEGKDQQIDEIADGMAPSTAQRRDVAVRNAMKRAAEALKSGFTPSRVRLAVASADDGEVTIADPTGALGIGQDAHVVRSIGRVSGIQGDVWMPVASLEVTGFGDGIATARQSGVEIAKVRRGDQVAHDTIGSLSASRFRYGQCATAAGDPVVVFRGAEQPLFRALSFNRLAAGFPGAVHATRFGDEAAPLALTSIAPEYREVKALTVRPADLCFEAVHNLTHTGQKRSGQTFVQNTYDLTVGYVLKRNDQRVGAQGLQQTLAATAVPADADATHQTLSVQIDLADFASDLALRAAKALNPNP
ncbi:MULTISPECIES: hypothetical protein [unclassified Brevundimonas]|uniref:hypothetical protein n=1 Tax=unclassified Brevundimonas TaxID=2622653 RepID=UPI003F9055EA